MRGVGFSAGRSVEARVAGGRAAAANGIARQFSQSNNPATFKIRSIRLNALRLKNERRGFSIEIAPNAAPLSVGNRCEHRN